jgi:hypothetical protein
VPGYPPHDHLRHVRRAVCRERAWMAPFKAVADEPAATTVIGQGHREQQACRSRVAARVGVKQVRKD